MSEEEENFRLDGYVDTMRIIQAFLHAETVLAAEISELPPGEKQTVIAFSLVCSHILMYILFLNKPPEFSKEELLKTAEVLFKGTTDIIKTKSIDELFEFARSIYHV